MKFIFSKSSVFRNVTSCLPYLLGDIIAGKISTNKDKLSIGEVIDKSGKHKKNILKIIQTTPHIENGQTEK